MKRFCEACGAKLDITPIWTRKYDGQTGEKTYNIYTVCPNRSKKFFDKHEQGGHLCRVYPDGDLGDRYEYTQKYLKKFGIEI